MLDNLWQDALNRIRTGISLCLRSGIATDKDWLDRTFRPVDVFRGVHRFLDVCAVEVVGLVGIVDEFSGEADDVGQERAHEVLVSSVMGSIRPEGD